MRVSTRWYRPRRFMKDSITEEYVQEIFEQYGLFGHHHGGNPCADDKMKPRAVCLGGEVGRDEHCGASVGEL